MRACKCLRLSPLSTICWQESDKRHGLSATTSGVCSCLFGSGIFWLHTIMFQTSTYMSACMIICMCVCSGACLHRCMYMSRTHNTHIHAHTTHTCLGLYVCISVVCALQEVQHVNTFTPLALGPGSVLREACQGHVVSAHRLCEQPTNSRP